MLCGRRDPLSCVQFIALSGQGCSTDLLEAEELKFNLKIHAYVSRDSGRWKMGVENIVQNLGVMSLLSLLPVQQGWLGHLAV